ncbi:MAG: DUF4097 domain-containing protein [Oscillospiraceae bacterium]|nr:DUF4097 domain-containing protein [Oscillospiraceae bacterium]
MKINTRVAIMLWVALGLVIIGIITYGITGRRSTLFRIAAGGAAVGAVAAGVTDNSSGGNIDITSRLPLEPNDSLDLNFSIGEITVSHSDDNQIHVTQRAKNIRESQILELTRSGSTVSVRPKGGDISWFGLNNVKNEVDVRIPAVFSGDLRISLSAGKLDILDGFSTDRLELSVSAGSLRSDSALTSKEAELTVSAGGIDLRSLQTDHFSLSTSAGELKIRGLTGSGRVRTSAGRVIAERLELTGDIDISTSAGSVTIGLAGDPGLEYELKASAGAIRTYFGASTSGSSKTVSGTYGNAPYYSLKAETSAGSVSINKVS